MRLLSTGLNTVSFLSSLIAPAIEPQAALLKIDPEAKIVHVDSSQNRAAAKAELQKVFEQLQTVGQKGFESDGIVATAKLIVEKSQMSNAEAGALLYIGSREAIDTIDLEKSANLTKKMVSDLLKTLQKLDEAIGTGSSVRNGVSYHYIDHDHIRMTVAILKKYGVDPKKASQAEFSELITEGHGKKVLQFCKENKLTETQLEGFFGQHMLMLKQAGAFDGTVSSNEGKQGYTVDELKKILVNINKVSEDFFENKHYENIRNGVLAEISAQLEARIEFSNPNSGIRA